MTPADAGRPAREVLAVKFGHRVTTRSESYLNFHLYAEPDADLDIDYFFWVIRDGADVFLVDTGFAPEAGDRRRYPGVRLRIIGDRTRFDIDIQQDLANAEAETAGNARLNLTVALSYGARAEIAAAARKLAAAVRDGTLDAAKIDEACVAGALATAGMPDPDLIIRTSGEQRLSNFLLWQGAYAELVFLDVFWPDFNAVHFAAALAEYAKRERRFGARPG